MPYKQNLTRATELKKQLDTLRPLTPEMETRILQKFRLDWNYHSSHIEGNQLTFGETKALLLFGHTAQAKPLKDHIEMTGHNEAIKYIEEIIQQERPLTEQFIRELHQLILKEPYEVDAITPEGKPTKRTIKIGQYKSLPNHVLTKTGEIFYFATPEETPAKMNDLIDWYVVNLNSDQLHPVLFATEFHYKFIRIHPFDDGNGRIARLLMNFILMQKGYPPAIIKTENKNEYFAALQQADTGQLDFFFNYICEQEIKSLELMIKGANGDSIDEPDDLDKKIALLEKELEAVDPNEEVQYRFSRELFDEIFHTWMGDLIKKVISPIQKFNHLFTGINHWINLAGGGSVSFIDQTPEEVFGDLAIRLPENLKHIQEYATNVTINAQYGTFKKGGLQSFGCNYGIEIKFTEIKYEIWVDEFEQDGNQRKPVKLYERLLHKALSKAEINEVIHKLTNSIYDHIDFYTKKNGLR